MWSKIFMFLYRTFPLWHKFMLWLLKSSVFPWLKEQAKKTDNQIDDKVIKFVETIIHDLDPSYAEVTKEDYQKVVDSVKEDVKEAVKELEDKADKVDKK